MKPVKLSRNALPAVVQTDSGNYPYGDKTESAVSGAVFRERNRTALQYF